MRSQVVPIYLLGTFEPRRYTLMYKDVKKHMGPARPGKFDDEGYRKLHPEVEEEDIEPFQHFKQNRMNEICVRGRVGLPNRRCASFGGCTKARKEGEGRKGVVIASHV